MKLLKRFAFPYLVISLFFSYDPPAQAQRRGGNGGNTGASAPQRSVAANTAVSAPTFARRGGTALTQNPGRTFGRAGGNAIGFVAPRRSPQQRTSPSRGFVGTPIRGGSPKNPTRSPFVPNVPTTTTSTSTVTNSSNTSTSTTNVITNNNYRNGYGWPFWGVGYVSYPTVLYYGYGYGGYGIGGYGIGGYGYSGWMGYNVFSVREKESGIKFELDSIRNKGMKDFAKDGVISIEDQAGNLAVSGSVKRLSKKTLHLQPGTYEIKVVFPDGRKLEMSVAVYDRQVTHVPITFTDSAQQAQVQK